MGSGKEAVRRGSGRRARPARPPRRITPLRYNPPGTSVASFDKAGNTLFFLSPPSP